MQTGENSIIEARIPHNSNSYTQCSYLQYNTSLWCYGWIQELIPLLYLDSIQSGAF